MRVVYSVFQILVHIMKTWVLGVSAVGADDPFCLVLGGLCFWMFYSRRNWSRSYFVVVRYSGEF
jgi:hypothetical protein